MSSMRRQNDFVLERGVSAVVACGKAGEFEWFLRRVRRRDGSLSAFFWLSESDNFMSMKAVLKERGSIP